MVYFASVFCFLFIFGTIICDFGESQHERRDQSKIKSQGLPRKSQGPKVSANVSKYWNKSQGLVTLKCDRSSDSLPTASAFAAVRGPGVKCHVTMLGREREGGQQRAVNRAGSRGGLDPPSTGEGRE